MREHLISLLKQSVDNLSAEGVLPDGLSPTIALTRSKDPSHGDFATNLAMMLGKSVEMAPRELAEKLISHLPASPQVVRVEIAGPGFINFFVAASSEYDAITRAIAAGDTYGYSDFGKGKPIHIEFVSANPTGPLHVGHGRGAAFGASVSNLLAAIGHPVHREYYVNDAGRQMRILAISIWLRYLQVYDIDITLPANAYQGDYVISIAALLREHHSKKFVYDPNAIKALFPKDIDAEANRETYVDQLIENAIQLMGDDNFEIIRQAGIQNVTADIKEDLEEFGVRYNEWFFESHMYEKGWLKKGIALLEEHGYTYEREGALWFKATALGDEKDRVLIRRNGQPTYFASDVAYHTYKYDQGYDEIIDVFGADHHGYMARLKAFLKGLGKDPDKLRILLVQFAILYRGKEKVSMSTRSGEFVTLRELRNEVGNDAARFFYIMRKPEQHLDFDLELAKSTSNENPVYYIQYAHARICSVWRQLSEKGLKWDQKSGEAKLDLLSEEDEKNLIAAIASFPEMIQIAAQQWAPHKLAHFLQSFAHLFHAYYNTHKFIVDDADMRNARLTLIAAARQVLHNGLQLLGVSVPESM